VHELEILTAELLKSEMSFCTQEIGYGNWQHLEGGKSASHLTEPNFMAEM